MEPAPTAPTAASTSRRRLAILRLLALALVITLSIVIFVFRERADELARYGYPGIFLLALLTNATVLLPVPGNLVVFAMGAVFNPLAVAVAAGLGAATGELSGYLAGFTGQAVIENSQRYQRIVDWLQNNRRWSDLAIFVLAAIPNPIFDMAGIAAGALRLPLWRFLLFCSLGKVLNNLLFAILGYFSLRGIFGP